MHIYSHIIAVTHCHTQSCTHIFGQKNWCHKGGTRHATQIPGNTNWLMGYTKVSRVTWPYPWSRKLIIGIYKDVTHHVIQILDHANLLLEYTNVSRVITPPKSLITQIRYCNIYKSITCHATKILGHANSLMGYTRVTPPKSMVTQTDYWDIEMSCDSVVPFTKPCHEYDQLFPTNFKLFYLCFDFVLVVVTDLAVFY